MTGMRQQRPWIVREGQTQQVYITFRYGGQARKTEAHTACYVKEGPRTGRTGPAGAGWGDRSKHDRN